MKKTSVRRPRVSCGTCRMFDGYTWCRHWNFFTDAVSPPCSNYRPEVPRGGGQAGPGLAPDQFPARRELIN